LSLSIQAALEVQANLECVGAFGPPNNPAFISKVDGRQLGPWRVLTTARLLDHKAVTLLALAAGLVAWLAWLLAKTASTIAESLKKDAASHID
jgi:hypothetical protein